MKETIIFTLLLLLAATAYLGLDQYEQRLKIEHEFEEFVDKKVQEDIKTWELVEILAKKKAR